MAEVLIEPGGWERAVEVIEGKHPDIEIEIDFDDAFRYGGVYDPEGRKVQPKVESLAAAIRLHRLRFVKDMQP